MCFCTNALCWRFYSAPLHQVFTNQVTYGKTLEWKTLKFELKTFLCNKTFTVVYLDTYIADGQCYNSPWKNICNWVKHHENHKGFSTTIFYCSIQYHIMAWLYLGWSDGTKNFSTMCTHYCIKCLNHSINSVKPIILSKSREQINCYIGIVLFLHNCLN